MNCYKIWERFGVEMEYMIDFYDKEDKIKNFSVFFTLSPTGNLFELSAYKKNSNIKYYVIRFFYLVTEFIYASVIFCDSSIYTLVNF